MHGNCTEKVIADMPLESRSPQPSHAQSGLLALAPREREVLKELAQGSSNKLIARTLSISTYTVDGYVKDIYRKLGVRSRAMAAIIAFRYGIVDMPPQVSAGPE